MITFWVVISIILVNIIFGYWRSNTRKFSWQWIAAIHVPVPIAIVLRLSFLGWNWLMLPVFVVAFAAGQYSGGKVRPWLRKYTGSLSSFLIADLYLLITSRKKAH